ncbi:hypothetical protein GCM10009665_45670 [Kitasatospora nipponensis]|uniref:AB hydrolase-1 domain-containing protein n=1 Tax=Kitasatospora nipponensis TaxID=258049 RepID=A0ABP4H8A8_9ACTN
MSPEPSTSESLPPLAVEEFGFAVPGGELAVLRWPATEPGASTVLALHGITANALAWGAVARRLAGRVTLVAPDLRGRAASAGVAGPYGLVRHADDAALLLAALGAGPAGGGPMVVAGHSMGAWATALTAVRHPELVRRVVLVDGAVSFPLPSGVSERDALGAVLGPALDRLSMTFADLDAYRAFWRAHPAWESLEPGAMQSYIERDLTGSAPQLRSACVREAIEVDGAQVLLDPAAARAVYELPCPGELLWAARGLRDEPQGLYDTRRLAGAEVAGPKLTLRHIAGSNHYSILMGEAGATAVAERILAAALGAA